MIEESFRRNCLTCRTDGQSAEETGWADMIETVTSDTIMQAAEIHSESWKESHKAISLPRFWSASLRSIRGLILKIRRRGAHGSIC